MRELLSAAERAARVAGEILLSYRGKFSQREKGPRDLVTEADLASQQRIRSMLLAEFPDHDFLGEEDDPSAVSTSASCDYRWIVDPLDGTLNYIHGLPAWAVSIAVERHGELLAGVVFDPVAEECFSAVAGGGAWLNGARIGTSGCSSVNASLVAASFPPLVTEDSYELTRFVAAILACGGVRRLGSAALNLAYVAAGRLDAYWATSVKIWDVAAGILLVREAGGLVTNVAGGPLELARPELLAGANAALHAELLPIINPPI